MEQLGKLSTFSEYNRVLAHCVAQEHESVEYYLSSFTSLQTNAERVDFMYEHLQRYDLLRDKFTPDSKRDPDARRHIRKGDNHFLKGNFYVALAHWTRAVMKAAKPTTLAEAYAKRSAALCKLGLFDPALEDIQRAFENGFPEAQSRCLHVRRETAERHRLQRPLPVYYQPPPQIHHRQRNRRVQGATNSVEIRKQSARVRVFATKDIKTGEVIAVERAYAWTMAALPNLHCHHCFNVCYNLLACKFCCQVGFCSETCAEEAREQYHRHECPILITLKNIVGHFKGFILALKMTFLREREYLRGAAYPADINRLIDAMNVDKLVEDLYVTSLVSALIYDLVKNHTDRFAGNRDPLVEEDFKNLLMLNIQLVQLYGAGIDELAPNPKFKFANPDELELLAFQRETVGSGLYPFYSLISHSCCPNIFVHHHGTTRVIRAMRPIKKGEELLASYGPHYVADDLEYRQRRCRDQYHFSCSCKACTEDWPQFDKQPYVIKDLRHLPLVSQIRAGNVATTAVAIPEFVHTIEEFQVFEPDPNVILYQKLLAFCYDIQGNTRKAI